MKKTLLAAALLCCLPAAYAADQNDASALAPVVVTATRTPITADDALSSVSVITRADIERLQPLSVADLLTGLPGISFAQSGGLGQLFTDGFQRDFPTPVIVGVVLTLLLAVVADALLVALQYVLTPWRRRRA